MHGSQEIISALERIAARSFDVHVARSCSPEQGYQLCRDPRKLDDLVSSVELTWNLPTLQEALGSVLAAVPAQ